MSKLDQIRGTFNRVHDDLFDADYEAEFINTSLGTRDNATDTFSGETESSIAKVPVEIVPPAVDTTVRETGTSFSWDTSIRFPEDVEDVERWGSNWGSNWGSETLIDVIKPLGEDNQRPTLVEITDMADNDTDRFELHGYSYEKGSGMVMCRLVEQ
jgi:hypothetical protein